MIILITGFFDKYDRQGLPVGKKELLVSHGVDYLTMSQIVLSQEPIEYYVRNCGAYFHDELKEWVLPD